MAHPGTQERPLFEGQAQWRSRHDRAYYLNQGYLEFAITSTQVTISPDKRDISITITVGRAALRGHGRPIAGRLQETGSAGSSPCSRAGTYQAASVTTTRLSPTASVPLGTRLPGSSRVPTSIRYRAGGPDMVAEPQRRVYARIDVANARGHVTRWWAQVPAVGVVVVRHGQEDQAVPQAGRSSRVFQGRWGSIPARFPAPTIKSTWW